MRNRSSMTAMALLGGALAVLAIGSYAVAGGGTNNVHEDLVGYQEVPAISTGASGSIELKIDEANSTIAYTLSYAGIEGGSAVAAHIHLGQPGVNGGVSAFLCGGGGKPACPAVSGSVSDTIVPSDVIGPASQGIAPGQFAELVAAIRAQKTYANVHSVPMWPGGELRAQLNAQPNDG